MASLIGLVLVGAIIGFIRAIHSGGLVLGIGVLVLAVVVAGCVLFCFKWWKASQLGDSNLEPLMFVCACHHKFQAMPLTPTPDEMLSAPCDIKFNRLSAMKGVNDTFYVYLNGRRICEITNNQYFNFTTMVRYNDVFVGNKYGGVLRGHRSFEALPGGKVELPYRGLQFV